MGEKLIGTPCDDCVEGLCTMNCSSAVPATGTEWIAASMWARVFPGKATASQVSDWRASRACFEYGYRSPTPPASPSIVADEPDAGEVTVTDADIDFAAEYLAMIAPDMPNLHERVRANRTALSRLAARHRHAAHEAGKREGREEAAKVCEQQAKDFLDPAYAQPQPIGSIQERFACTQCATAIRALSQQDTK